MFRWLFKTGWGRLFLVAWPAWAFLRFRYLEEEGSWLFDYRGDDFFFTGVLLPPVALLVGRWVWRGFRGQPAISREKSARMAAWLKHTATEDQLLDAVALRLVLTGAGASPDVATAAALHEVFIAQNGTEQEMQAGRRRIAAARHSIQTEPAMKARFESELASAKEALDEARKSGL